MTAAELFEREQRRRTVVADYLLRSLELHDVAVAAEAKGDAHVALEAEWASARLDRAADAELHDPDPRQ